eukprot:365802-Chlamydomonas_euryale.AAC.17
MLGKDCTRTLGGEGAGNASAAPTRPPPRTILIHSRGHTIFRTVWSTPSAIAPPAFNLLR